MNILWKSSTMFEETTANLLPPFDNPVVFEKYQLKNAPFPLWSENLSKRKGRAGEVEVTAAKGVVAAVSRLVNLTERRYGGGIGTYTDENGRTYVLCSYYGGDVDDFGNGKPAPMVYLSIDAETSEVTAITADEYGNKKSYAVKTAKKDSNKYDGSPYIFAFLSFIYAFEKGWVKSRFLDDREESVQKINVLLKNLNGSGGFSVFESTAFLSDQIITMLNERLYDENGNEVPCPIDKEKIVQHVHMLRVEEIQIKTEMGSFAELNGSAKKEELAKTIGELKGKYDPTPDYQWDEESKSRMVSLPSYYQIPEKLQKTALLYKKTFNKRHKLNSFILCGPAGVGKSVFTRVFAYATGRPHVILCASRDMEKVDLTLSMIPADADNVTFTFTDSEVEEFAFDPESAYEKLTGVRKEGATPSDCLIAAAEKMSRKGGGTEFRYVPSPLLEAYQKGWVVEIQEATLLPPAVLTSLNSMFDDNEKCILVDGREINRHPNNVVFITTNLSYEGCLEMNQSVYSRFTPIELSLPTDNILVDRLMNESEYHNRPILERMVAVYHAAIKKAEQLAVTDGAIDFRALADWAASTAVDGNVFSNGIEYFINKCSMDTRNRQDFVECLLTQFNTGETCTPEEEE